MGFLSSSAGKESACSSGDLSSIPGSGRSPAEGIGYPLQYFWASLVAQMVKNLPAMRETWIWSLGWEGSPGRGHGNSLQYFCLENPQGWRSLVGYNPWGRKESDMTEWLRAAQRSGVQVLRNRVRSRDGNQCLPNTHCFFHTPLPVSQRALYLWNADWRSRLNALVSIINQCEQQGKMKSKRSQKDLPVDILKINDKPRTTTNQPASGSRALCPWTHSHLPMSPPLPLMSVVPPYSRCTRWIVNCWC